LLRRRKNDNHSVDKKQLKDLVNTSAFPITFNSEVKAQTTSVSSEDLAAASAKGTKLYDVKLETLRKCGKL